MKCRGREDNMRFSSSRSDFDLHLHIIKCQFAPMLVESAALREGKLAISRANTGCKMFESYSHMQTHTRSQAISFVSRAIYLHSRRLVATRHNECIEITEFNHFLDMIKFRCCNLCAIIAAIQVTKFS